MAGFPPQQHYAAPPQPSPYHAPPPYGLLPGGPPVHHGYPPPMPPPGVGPYQSAYGGPGGGPSGGPWPEQHFDHHPPPQSAMHGHPHAQGGPPSSLPRPGYGAAGAAPGPPPPSSNGVHQGPPHPSQAPQQHGQPMQHQGQPSLPPQYAGMPPHDYHPGHPQPLRPRAGPSQLPGPPVASAHHQGIVQPSAPPARSAQATKRANAAASARDKERGTKSGGGQRRTTDKQGGRGNASSKAEAASAKAEAARAAAEAAALDEPVQESKKIRKRKEVVDRIHRVHWDTMENRDLLYNDLQHSLAATGSVLLLSPGLSRPYMLALQRLTLERDAQLRQSALLHAHQVESARTAYEQDRGKVEDEARSAKRAVRDRLLAAVEERRKRLREDKEGGEGMSDALLDSSTRAHATRKLRNKGPGASRHDVNAESDAGAPLSSRGAKANGAANGTGSLGLSLGGSGAGNGNGAGSDTAGATSGSKAGGGGDGTISQPLLSSLLELTGLTGGIANGHIAALPPSNFDALTSGAATATLLHIGVGGGMGDSSYMAGLRATLQSQSKSKKKSQSGKGGAASSANAMSGAIGGSAGAGGSGGAGAGSGVGSGDGMGGDDDEEEGTRSMAAAAAAAVAAATMLNGTGRLRWEQGKSVGQLTGAKDIEIESDLINIRKVGNKRRRR